MTLAPAPPVTPAPPVEPSVPAQPTPAEAFRTPHAVLAWLLRAQEEGRRVVGYVGSPNRCPLATFAERELGLEHVGVDGGWGGSVDAVGLRYRGPNCYEQLLLPPWCRSFVVRVDAQHVTRVSPQRALRILGEVMRNMEFGV